MEMVCVSMFFLISVSFYIVTERKGLGNLQVRKGPNKVGFKGLGQPVADGVKLVLKEALNPSLSIKIFYYVGPLSCFICAYSMWGVFPSKYNCLSMSMGVLFFLCISCMSVYGVFMVGWSCDSSYGVLGAMRAIAQSVSYEILLSTCVFCPLVLVGSFSLDDCRSSDFPAVIMSMDVLCLWVFCVLAETNRAPFDFVEGESELVAGYMVEFGGANFALLALAEYSNMIFMSMVTSVMFFSGCLELKLVGGIIFSLEVVMISYFVIWVRGVVPRFRYDLLMELCWKNLLFLSICLFSCSMGIWMELDILLNV